MSNLSDGDLGVKVSLVSIILPTYNRAPFLRDALVAIASQSYRDWELIVIDDGSTDDTSGLVSRFADGVIQRVTYVYQENSGAYAARNSGLDAARGQYIAFYDSDDIWLRHHVENCVRVLDENSDIDWVYGSFQRVCADTGEVIEADNFRKHGTNAGLLQLSSELRPGGARILSDNATLCVALDTGIGGSLQSSVIRATHFESWRFDANYRNGQDRFAFIECLLRRRGVAYFDRQHLTYRVHSGNDSLSRKNVDLEKRMLVAAQLREQYERLLGDCRLSSAEFRAVKRRLACDTFWVAGYAAAWKGGNHRQALRYMCEGISYAPGNATLWKTYVGCLIKYCLRYGLGVPGTCVEAKGGSH